MPPLDRFDLVYSVDVIHHIAPTVKLVSYYQEPRRVSKKGGGFAQSLIPRLSYARARC